jgi:UDP-glucose 4-epimerase
MKKILITGGAGFIGNALTLFLSKKNYQITCLVSKKNQPKLKNVKYIYGKIEDNFDEELKTIDLIIHCAAAGVYKKEKKGKIFKINCYDSLNFFKRAYKVGCRNWIILGTSGEYGFVKDKPMSLKNTKLKPLDTYGRSKTRFFKLLSKLKIIKECKVLYLRIFHPYGEKEPSGRLYSDLLAAAKDNKEFTMTEGEEVRDFIHIDIVVKKIQSGFRFFKNKNFFLVKHVALGKKIKVKEFVKYHWKKNKAKKKIIFGKLKRKIKYHTMYSDKASIL